LSQFFKKLNCYSLSKYFFRVPFLVNFIVPIPGTEMYDEAVKRNLISPNKLEHLFSLDDSSRHSLKWNLTSLDKNHFIELIDKINGELEKQYYMKHPFQRIISKYTNLYHFRWKETFKSILSNNNQSLLEGLLWTLSRGGTKTFYTRIYKRLVYRHKCNNRFLKN
jgi:radical SAM superfamily enzyme YgiQ (UPF0313 family)